jgi:hypothetical protein
MIGRNDRMAEFSIEIKEHLSRVVNVEANSLEDAIAEVSKRYKEEKIVLTDQDFVDYEIQPLEN